jgi:replicative DNA helicase
MSAEVAADKLPPQNEEAETSVVGTILLAEKALDRVVLEVGLRPRDFYRERHRLIYTAILALRDLGRPIDALTVSEQLDRDGQLEEAGGKGYVHSLPNLVPAAGNVREYARIVSAHAKARRQLAAARAVQEAVYTQDERGVQLAIDRLLSAEIEERGGAIAGEELANRLCARIEEGIAKAWALPFHELTKRSSGGLHPGNVTLIGGWTSHGKSAVAGQIAIDAAYQGAKCRYYLTADMTTEEAALRVVSYWTGISYSRLLLGDLKEIEWPKFTEAMERINKGEPFPFVEAYDWSAQEIAQDIRRATPDLAIVDILHELEYEGERDLRRIGRTFNTVARQTGTHLIATVHLNDERAKEATLPPPVQRDIKGASSLRQQANNVLFVWRENAEDAIKRHGRIYFAKVRGGIPGGIDVTFRGAQMRFEAGHAED